MDYFFSWLAGAIYLMCSALMAFNVIMKRRPVGVSLAWLVLLIALPIAGFIFYLLFGSPRLGARRLKVIEKLKPDYKAWSDHLVQLIQERKPSGKTAIRHKGIYRLAEQTILTPSLPDNRLRLFDQSDHMIAGMLADIRSAQSSIIIEMYIWEPEGRVYEIAEEMIAAAQRGVNCLVVLDAVGSRNLLNSHWIKRFRSAGMIVHSAMPVGPLRMLVERIDMRNHRKILVVDDKIAWTGSFNLVDPHYFKRDARVGEWVDAMVRIEGVAAQVLSAIVAWDKTLETKSDTPPFKLTQTLPVYPVSDAPVADMHVLPSGPGSDRELLHQVLLSAIYEAEEELLISTPYFIPDEALLTALKSAAMRSVTVKLLVPEKNDSIMVHHASRAYYEELLISGVEIHQFKGGLLHTKCALIDRSTVLFGTVNLDMRSVWLNFEVTLIIYGDEFGEHIDQLMASYLHNAESVPLSQWKARAFRQKLLENTMQLLSPLL